MWSLRNLVANFASGIFRRFGRRCGSVFRGFTGFLGGVLCIAPVGLTSNGEGRDEGGDNYHCFSFHNGCFVALKKRY